jgi:hypothetical protein
MAFSFWAASTPVFGSRVKTHQETSRFHQYVGRVHTFGYRSEFARLRWALRSARVASITSPLHRAGHIVIRNRLDVRRVITLMRKNNKIISCARPRISLSFLCLVYALFTAVHASPEPEREQTVSGRLNGGGFMVCYCMIVLRGSTPTMLLSFSSAPILLGFFARSSPHWYDATTVSKFHAHIKSKHLVVYHR